MITLDQEFYLFPEELYRMGNSGNHRLTAIKPREVDVTVINEVETVLANGKGVSLFTLEGAIVEGLTGFAWKFEKGTGVVAGLKLVKDRPDHYMLAPVHNMPFAEYIGLLNDMGIRCSKHLKINKDGTVVQV